jgi:hypothetical protein
MFHPDIQAELAKDRRNTMLAEVPAAGSAGTRRASRGPLISTLGSTLGGMRWYRACG